jgi:tellurite resistance protein TerC
MIPNLILSVFSNEALFFGCFTFFILIMLSLDLGIFNKRDRVIGFKTAALMSAVWVSCAVLFYFFLRSNGHILHGVSGLRELAQLIEKHHHLVSVVPGDFSTSLELYDKNLALEFLTGYLIEYALSVDNIFVIVLIFAAFGVEERYYHRVLFWGILGAIIMRFIFIFAGATLIGHFNWILYLFGAFLIYTGVAMFRTRGETEKIDPETHWVVRWASKFLALHPHYVGKKFFVKIGGKKMITPLFLVLMVIEFTDLIFAVDSIPAIFAVTKDPYMVFFSNIFAILGLRSLFFLLMNIIHKFHYLKTGLAVLLTFIGVKMIFHDYLSRIGFSTVDSLFIILGILTVSILASLIFPKKKA